MCRSNARQELLSKYSAIRRNKLSQPMSWLIKNGMILRGDLILDYGCGRGEDIRFMRGLGYAIDGYDINWKDYTPTRRIYNVVTCFYVVNVTLPAFRLDLFRGIYKLLSSDGIVYFAVRGDVKDVTETRGGLFQYSVCFDNNFLVKRSSSMLLYSVPFFAYRDLLLSGV